MHLIRIQRLLVWRLKLMSVTLCALSCRAAAGFLDGLGSALAQGDSSVVTNGTVTITTQGSQGFKQGMYKGLGEAANTAGTFFRDQANQTKPLVRVASGDPSWSVFCVFGEGY